MLAPRTPIPDARDEVEPAVSAGVLMAIVNARGVVDERTVGPLARELAGAIRAGATRLLVDLSRVDDAATACMNTLLAARQIVADRGGRIAVVLSPAMRRRFEKLQLDKRFLIADDRLDAVRRLGLADPGSPRNAPQRAAA
jgi:anti-anti-sigma regulatory factor